MLEAVFDARVDPVVHARHPDYVALVLFASGVANGPSAEALMSRALKGETLPRINALVDLYNAVSVRHVVPLGGEDADQLEGPLRLTITAGGEPFDPRGDGTSVEHVAAGEVVRRDDRGVTCRRWNWRQGRRTQLTGSTTHAFFVFDRLDGLTVDRLHQAADELSLLLRNRWPSCRLDRIERHAP